MCGRFVLATKVSGFIDDLSQSFDPDLGEEQYFSKVDLDRLHREAITLEAEITPQYNIAPRWKIPALYKVDDEEVELDVFKWGLLPPWSKDPKFGDKCFNARSETAAEKPTFRSAFKHSRAVIFADGYYEWKKLDSKNKQPYFIHLKNSEPMFIAGLVEPKTQTTSILTTEAEGDLANIHNRHPVFLSPDEIGEWLDNETPREALNALMQPNQNVEDIEAYPVSKRVSKVGEVNDASLIEEFKESLF